MSVSMNKFVSDCLIAAGDTTGATWSRTTVAIPWANEAMLAFPILCPKQTTITVAGAATHEHDLPAGFRQLVSVEYPLSQDPPEFLDRMNHLDPSFYASNEHYDVDRNYADTAGWVLWTSKKVPVGGQLKVNYLANHKTDCTDEVNSFITIPDEYEYICVSYFVVKAYRERLSYYMTDPTAHMAVIAQLTDMVVHAEENYRTQVQDLLIKYTDSRILPHRQIDKFDRTY